MMCISGFCRIERFSKVHNERQFTVELVLSFTVVSLRNQNPSYGLMPVHFGGTVFTICIFKMIFVILSDYHTALTRSQMASRNVSCAGCNNVFTDPRLLPCLHVFCRGCLESLYSPNEGTLTCPTCYSVNTCPAPDQLPRQIRLERESTLSSIQLQETTLCRSCEGSGKVQAYCEDCDGPICSDCVESHKRINAIKNHSVVPLDQSQPTVQRVVCVFHSKEPVKYYCSSCRHLMCSECLFEHKEHECCHVDSEELLEREKGELCSLLLQVEDTISPLVTAIDDIGEIIEQVTVSKEQAIGDVDQAFKRISEAVEKRRLELIQEVVNSAVAKSTQLEIQKEALEKISHALKVALSTGRMAANDYTSIELLGVIGAIVSASKQGLDESSAADLHPVCDSNIKANCNSAEIIDLVTAFGSVSSHSPYPPLCSLVGINPKLPIGVAKDSECIVTLQTRDRNGEDMMVTGTETRVEGSLVDGEHITECIVSGLDNGRYEISFNPSTTQGQYLLHITVNGVGVGDSPFNVNVRDYASLTGPIASYGHNSLPAYIDIGSSTNHRYITHDNGLVKVYNDRKKVRQLNLGERMRGIAVDEENGIMFLASAGTHEIIKATLDGVVISSVKRQAGRLELSWPMGLTLTRDGYVLVGGYSSKRILVFGPDLSFVRSIPCSSSVWGVSTDSSGNIHAAVTDKVEVHTLTGEKVTEYGQGVLTQAGDIAFLSRASSCECCYSFVTDHVAAGKVVIFDWLKDTVVCSLATGPSLPLGVTIEQDGTIIVCVYETKKLLSF